VRIQVTGEDTIDSALTVAQLCSRFLASRAGEAAGTRSLYRLVCDLYLVPCLGHVRVAELRRSQVEALRNDLLTSQPAAVVETRVARALACSALQGGPREALERTTRARFAGKPVGVHTARKVLAVLVSVLN
jgi:hypothetical protein